MLVLPPFQRIGLGAQLLDNIYRHYTKQAHVTDITGVPCFIKYNTVSDVVKNATHFYLCLWAALKRMFLLDYFTIMHQQLRLCNVSRRFNKV
jgi:hypothetical protein